MYTCDTLYWYRYTAKHNALEMESIGPLTGSRRKVYMSTDHGYTHTHTHTLVQALYGCKVKHKNDNALILQSCTLPAKQTMC